MITSIFLVISWERCSPLPHFIHSWALQDIFVPKRCFINFFFVLFCFVLLLLLFCFEHFLKGNLSFLISKMDCLSHFYFKNVFCFMHHGILQKLQGSVYSTTVEGCNQPQVVVTLGQPECNINASWSQVYGTELNKTGLTVGFGLILQY